MRPVQLTTSEGLHRAVDSTPFQPALTGGGRRDGMLTSGPRHTRKSPMIENVMKVGRLLLSPMPILVALLCPGQQPTGALQVHGYDAVRSTLSSRTSVPVRLPTFIPPYADRENPIYAIVDSAGLTSYSI